MGEDRVTTRRWLPRLASAVALVVGAAACGPASPAVAPDAGVDAADVADVAGGADGVDKEIATTADAGDASGACPLVRHCGTEPVQPPAGCTAAVPALTQIGHVVVAHPCPTPVFWRGNHGSGLVNSMPSPFRLDTMHGMSWLWSAMRPAHPGEKAKSDTLRQVRVASGGVFAEKLLPPVVHPRLAFRDAAGTTLVGSQRTPALDEGTVVARLSQDGKVLWQAKIAYKELSASLPLEATHALVSAAMKMPHAIHGARTKDGVWVVYTTGVEGDSSDPRTGMFLMHVDGSGKLTLRASMLAKDRNGASPWIAVYGSRYVAVMDPTRERRYATDDSKEHSLNTDARLHCHDGYEGVTHSALVAPADSGRIPLDVLPADHGFNVVSAIYTQDELPKLSDLGSNGYQVVTRTLEISAYSPECKLLWRRKEPLWDKRGFVLDRTTRARLPGGAFYISGVTRDVTDTGPVHPTTAGGIVVLGPDLRVIKRESKTDEFDANEPQVLQGDHVVLTRCTWTVAMDEPSDCHYLITDAWLRTSCAEAGVCHALSLADCKVDDPCRVPTCDPVTGCGSVPLAEGAPCGTGGVCTQGKCVK